MRNSSKKTVLKRVLAYVLAVALTMSIITVPSTDAYAASGSVKSVTVTNLPAKQVTIKKGKSFVIKPRVTVSGKISKAVIYKTSNSKVAKVSAGGKITAVKNGKATVTVISKANRKKYCKVAVTVGTPVSSVKLNKASVSINKGKTYTLKATISPKSASNKSLTWKTSNKKVATVSSKGVVKAVGKGTASITATANDGSGKKAVCKVTVKVNIPVSSIKLNKTTAELVEGNSVDLNATVAPSNATNKSVKWSTSNAKVATVSSKGNVKAVGVGTANITVAATDGSGKKAVCKVTVKAKPVVNPEVKVSNITLSLADETIYVGEKTQASVEVEPENATKKEVVYKVSDETYASIDENGVIVAKKEGTVKIIATAVDGSGIFGEKVLTIEGIPTVEFTQKNVSLAIGKETTLSVKDKTLSVKYESNDSNVISVVNEATGQIRAVAAGRATVTVSLVDFPDVKDTCNVVVLNDNTVIISEFAGLTQAGTFTVKLSMLSDTNKVTDDMLIGTKLYIVNETTGKKIQASYVSDSFKNNTATYAFNSSNLSSGTYILNVAADSIFAINSGSVDDLKQTVQITELKTGIAGHVYNSGKPVFGVTVICKAKKTVINTATTDIDGYYEMDVPVNLGYTIEISKEGYFDTSKSGVYVNNNEITTADMTINSINNEELAIYGHVISGTGVELEDLVRPDVNLYEKVDGKWVNIASTTVSKDGYYAFVNSKSTYIYDGDKYMGQHNYIKFASDSANKLSKDKLYKIVVSKSISAENETAVCQSAEVSNIILSTTSKETQVDNITLNKVNEFKGLTIPSGEITWDNKDSRPTTDETYINCTIYSTSNVETKDGYQYEKVLAPKKVKLNDTMQASVEDVNLISAEDKLTLPAGDYYAIITNGNCASVYKSFTVTGSETGVKKLDKVEFAPAVDYGFTMRIAADSSFYVNNPKYDVDVTKYDDEKNPVYIETEDLTDKKIGNTLVDVEVYEMINGVEVKVGTYTDVKFKIVVDKSHTKSIDATVPIEGLIKGKTYRIKVVSNVLSYTGEIPGSNESYSEKNGYYEFKYEGAEKNNVIPMLAMQANITAVKLVNIEDQFDKYDPTKAFLVNKVTLTDKNGEEVKSLNVNRYYTCGKDHEDAIRNAEENTAEISKIDGSQKGGDLITNGIQLNGAFSNINPGKYSLNISINGYSKLSVPVLSDGNELQGLREGEYVVEAKNQFKYIDNTNICGTIKDYDFNIVKDPVYITVLNKRGQVVATDVTNNGTYKIISGDHGNQLNIGETYTIVFRSAEYAVRPVSVKEALVFGANTQDDILLEEATGEIDALIYEEGTETELFWESSARAYALDSKYVDESDSDKFINDEVQSNYRSLGLNGKNSMTRTRANAAFWSAKGVEKDTYTVYVVDEKYNDDNYVPTYSSVKSSKSVSIAVDGDRQDIGKIFIPRATSIPTTPVNFKIKKDERDLNAGGYDIIKIFSVADDGSETLVDSQCCSSDISYTTKNFKLPVGKYRVYVYSMSYYRFSDDFTVSTISEKVVVKNIALTEAVEK